MIEFEGNMWKARADAWVITTNGDVNQNGEAVMGRGCALEAKSRFPQLAYILGALLNFKDNHVWDLGTWGRYQLISFPVKHHWYGRADMELIERSALELVELVDLNRDWLRVIVPRPGCGNGALKWSDVKLVLEPILDDRFILASKSVPVSVSTKRAVDVDVDRVRDKEVVEE